MSVTRPRREKDDHKMKVHENTNDVCCLHKLMKLLRQHVVPHQIYIFCQPVENGAMHVDEHHCDPHDLTTPQQHAEIARAAAAHSNFENTEHTTAHSPRKHVHDLMDCCGDPLGACYFFHVE